MPVKRQSRIFQDAAGFVMTHTVIILFLLAVFAVLFGRATGAFNRGTDSQIRQIELKARLYSKVYETLFKISENNFSADSAGGILHIREKINAGRFLVVEDESGKINLSGLRSKNKVFQERMETGVRRLFATRKVHPMIADRLIKEVKSQKEIIHLEDIQSLNQLSPDLKGFFDRYLTFYSDGKINVNTASKEVLDVLLEDENPFLVKQLLREREKEPFSDLEVIRGLSDEIKQCFSVQSHFFSIKIVNERGDPFFKTIVRCSLGEMQIVEWMER